MKYFKQTGMKYWDDFDRRAEETIKYIKKGDLPPLRRVSLHITEKCNMFCSYCNEKNKHQTLPKELAYKLLYEYNEMGGGILHVTGGEPTTVPYLAELIKTASKLNNIKFHLNTNLYNIRQISKVMEHIKRLKVSLDTCNANKFNNITGRADAFQRVTNNLDKIHKDITNHNNPTLVSITYTVNKDNFRDIPNFLRMYYKRWPHFYAVFFSSYKGSNKDFSFNEDEIEELFGQIVPKMQKITKENQDDETRLLFKYSHDRHTFKQVDRFPENRTQKCYIQLSELIIDSWGEAYNCSHLFRDGGASATELNIANHSLYQLFDRAKAQIKDYPLSHHCVYGCNKKLLTFNQKVEENL